MVVPEKVSTDTKLYEEPVYFSIDVKDLECVAFEVPLEIGRLVFKRVSSAEVGNRVLVLRSNHLELIYIKTRLQLENISVDSIVGKLAHFEIVL